jgi:chemotaxis family two-component system sensor kinase Cph1
MQATLSNDQLSSLTECDREPIHLPGSIQPHGVLFAVDLDNLEVIELSENVEALFSCSASSLFGTSVSKLLPSITAVEWMQRLKSTWQNGECEPQQLGEILIAGDSFAIIAHRSGDKYIVELEPEQPSLAPDDAGELHASLGAFIGKVQTTGDSRELCRATAEEVRRITQFDRVLIYRFDEDGSGVVLGEARNDVFPSLEDHHFPESDIPKQARELYRINRLRIIPDANYQPARIISRDDLASPLDLSRSVLRSVSPVHVEYMKNMGTSASMSISIVLQDKLWGLISCHNAAPRQVDFETRKQCDLLARIFALQISAGDRLSENESRVLLHSKMQQLLHNISSHPNWITGLVEQSDDLLAFMGATGAAILTNESCTFLGNVPDESYVRTLTRRFADSENPIFDSDSLPSLLNSPINEAMKASGALGIQISEINPTSIVWFRPEVIQTIRWGGDPRKNLSEVASEGRINPRKSFETWRETIRGKSTPWSSTEKEVALEFRAAIQGLILKKAEELAQLTTELSHTNANLERSNKELEAFSYSVSHDLRAPLRHIVGYAEMLKENLNENQTAEISKHADTIIECSIFAGKLVDNLLSFSRMGRTDLRLAPVEMNELLREAIQESSLDATGREIEWKIASLPTVQGDHTMLKTVWVNLISNALKYTRESKPTKIMISCHEHEKFYEFSVRDNGVGFDMRYLDKLFGVFQRLHRWEDYEGTGIGLANVRRIVERHGGKAWAEGAVNQGACFYFTLPKPSNN